MMTWTTHSSENRTSQLYSDQMRCFGANTVALQRRISFWSETVLHQPSQQIKLHRITERCAFPNDPI